MNNPQLLKLAMSKTNFNDPNNVQSTEVQLYIGAEEAKYLGSLQICTILGLIPVLREKKQKITPSRCLGYQNKT